MMRRMLQYGQIILRLGVQHVAAVAFYRYQLKRGVFERNLPAQSAPDIGAFWQGEARGDAVAVEEMLRQNIIARADAVCAGKFKRFSGEAVDEGTYPNWFKGVYVQSAQQHFARVPVNTVAGEDVKQCWDLSRMHWAPQLALAAAVSDGPARVLYLARLDALTQHWVRENGYQRGVNWACAQEVSVRGLQLMLASMILERHLGRAPAPALLQLLQQSWQRVFATFSYGQAQQNNHSLTELIFLIYAASLLRRQDIAIASHVTMKRLRRRLPRLIQKLVLPDGGCAMYSTNYSRVFCDMLAIAKLCDDWFEVGILVQPMLQQRVICMVEFLAGMVEPVSGAMPLIGHNDGSLHCLQYSPFVEAMPSVLLLGAVWGVAVPIAAERSMADIWLFGYVPKFETLPVIANGEQWFDETGIVVFDQPNVRLYLKYPRRRFRPSQEDFLHLDVWVAGENVLSDAGTYSYNPPAGMPDMTAAQAHNVPTVFGRALLNKISPFLYGFWPTTRRLISAGSHTFTVQLAGGVWLERRLSFTPGQCVVEDRVLPSEAWGVVWHGELVPTDRAEMVQLGKSATLYFSNVHSRMIEDTWCAPNYLTCTPSKRLVLTPVSPYMPIITTLCWQT